MVSKYFSTYSHLCINKFFTADHQFEFYVTVRATLFLTNFLSRKVASTGQLSATCHVRTTNCVMYEVKIKCPFNSAYLLFSVLIRLSTKLPSVNCTSFLNCLVFFGRSRPVFVSLPVHSSLCLIFYIHLYKTLNFFFLISVIIIYGKKHDSN